MSEGSGKGGGLDYRALFAQSPWPIFVIDTDSFRILEVNEAAVERYGYTRAELLSMLAFELRPKEEVADFTAAFRAHGLTGSQKQLRAPRTWRHRTKDGTVFDADIWRMNVTFDGRPAQMALIHDASPRLRLESQLRQAQKMEAVGLLAGGIAHDFNNLLTVIVAEAQLAERALGFPSAAGALDSVRGILETAEKAASITRQLLALSRRHVVRAETMDLNSVVTGFAGLLARIVGKDIAVDFRPAPAPLTVRVDRARIDQVLLNLCNNARQAMPDGGRLSVETHATCVDADFAVRQPWARTGRFAEIRVVDTGAGMDAATIARIFEPFFTTKDGGTGLGLSVVYGIVQEHDGCVGVESSPGAGTTVRILLPQVADAEA